MKRSHHLTLLVLGFMAVALCGTVLAQSDSSTVSGTVVSSSGSSLVIRTDDGSQMTFSLDGSSMLPDRIEPGQRVTISYHTLAGGTYHAANVVLNPTETPNAATAPTGTPADTEYRPTAANENMPRTASPMPLIALIGVLSIGTALGIRMLARHGA